jgi:hypothetical protein
LKPNAFAKVLPVAKLRSAVLACWSRINREQPDIGSGLLQENTTHPTITHKKENNFKTSYYQLDKAIR